MAAWAPCPRRRCGARCSSMAQAARRSFQVGAGARRAPRFRLYFSAASRALPLPLSLFLEQPWLGCPGVRTARLYTPCPQPRCPLPLAPEQASCLLTSWQSACAAAAPTPRPPAAATAWALRRTTPQVQGPGGRCQGEVLLHEVRSPLRTQAQQAPLAARIRRHAPLPSSFFRSLQAS